MMESDHCLIFGDIVRCRVCIRPEYNGHPAKEETKLIDGKEYDFEFMWNMDEGELYPGEQVFLPSDESYPAEAPQWIASGDLERVERVEGL